MISFTPPLILNKSDTLQVKSLILVKQTDICYILGSTNSPKGNFGN